VRLSISPLARSGCFVDLRLVLGALGRPDNSNRGYYVRPTIFADVDNSMTIARQEIFGPVLAIIPFKNEDEAISIANDTEYRASHPCQFF
jgi:aldehyde dehydrogenase (NAD+)